MSTTTFFAANEPEPELSSNATSSTNPTTQKQPLTLPEVPYNDTTKLDMSTGSTTVKLDHLGPMVVNADGTLARISNWQGMTDLEKEQTLRIVGKRNEIRLKALREKKEGEQEK